MSEIRYIKERRDAHILYLSNATFSPSGYGNQANHILYDWLKQGYTVRQATNYGLHGARLGLNNLELYPALEGDLHGDKTARLIFMNWKTDIFMTLYDIWMGAYVDGDPARPETLHAIHPHWIPTIMVDHDPVPEGTVINARCAYKTICPTKWGVEQLKKNGVASNYIPFGIDTKVWKPAKDEEEKRENKKWLQNRSIPLNLERRAVIDEDTFLIHINGANKDPYRKAFMRSFIAVQLFLQNNPDAEKDTRIYIHSWMKLARDIPHGAKTLQVDWACKASSDYQMLCSVPDETMARIGRTADVFLHPTQGGGFEIPVLEAMASGIPVITTDFVALPEIVGDGGWLIPCKTKYFSPLDATQAIADEFKMADALEEAYNKSKKRKSLGRKARKKALEYDWKKVDPLYHRLLDEVIDEMKYTSLEERER